MKKYNIFLDDERFPKTNKDWTIVRSYNELVSLIEKVGIENVTHISFDNDLGEELEGYDCAKWLVDQKYDLRHIEINVHSANSKAPDNIYKLINNWNKMVEKFGTDYSSDVEFEK